MAGILTSTIYFLTGFENGLINAASSGGLFSSVGTGWSASTISPRNGNYCANLVAPANTATSLPFPIVGFSGSVAIRFGVKIRSLPSSGNAQIAYLTEVGTGKQYSFTISNTGVLSYQGPDGVAIPGPTLDTTNWHYIDFTLFVSGTSSKMSRWRVDGVLQTQYTAALMDGVGINAFNLGTSFANQPGFTIDYDDVIGGFGFGEVGNGGVLAHPAGVDGAHLTITSLSPGDSGTAYSGTPTTVNTMVDDPPGTGGWTATRSNTDNIALRVANSGAYAEIKPAVTSKSEVANGVRAIMSYSSSSTQANLAACDVRNSAGTINELWGLTGGVGKAYNIVANQLKAAIVTRPAANWTASEINAIRFRFGGCVSADISPVPTVQAMMLEVDWPIVYGTPADETIIDDFNRADGPIYNGAGADIWESFGALGNDTTITAITTVNNQMAGALGSVVRSKAQLQSDFDLLWDMPIVDPASTGSQIFFGLTDVGTSSWDAFRLNVRPGSNLWELVFFTNAISTVIKSVTSPKPVNGSSVWISKRGATISVYYRAFVGGQFAQILTVDDARNNIASSFAIQHGDTTSRFDNLRGGPFVSTGTTYNDTQSGSIEESGSSTEDYSHDADISGTITASGSGVESYSVPADYIDSASGTITSSGTGTDNRIGDDTTVGTSTISGNGVDSSIGNDSRSGTVTASGVETESYSYADSSFGTATSSGSGIESYQATYIDIASGTVISSGTRTESYSYADSGSGTVTASGSGVDQLAYVDSGSGTVTVSGNSVEQIVYADSGSGTVISSGSRTESYNYADSGSGTGTISGSGVENYQLAYVDSGSGTVTVSGSGVESYQVASAYTDSSSGTITVSGSGVESYQATYADIASGSVVVSGSGTESYSRSDSGLGTITSSGTRTESYSYADSGFGTINASGAGSDARVYTDTNIGTIVATGTGSDNRVYSDTNTGTISGSGTSTETASHSSSAVGTCVVTGTGIDSKVYTDAVSGTVSVNGSGVDSSEILIGYVDANNGQINSSGTSVESQSHTSTAIGSVVADGTSVESQIHTNTSIGSVVTSGTRSESQSHSNAAIGFVFVEGTGSESYSVRNDIVYTDSAAGTATSTGTGFDSVSYSSTTIGTITSTGTSVDSVSHSSTTIGTITWIGIGVESGSYEDTSSGNIVLTGTAQEDTGYTPSLQPVPFSTVIALNRFKIEIWNQAPIQSKITNTAPVSVQIELRQPIKVNATQLNQTKVLIANR